MMIDEWVGFCHFCGPCEFVGDLQKFGLWIYLCSMTKMTSLGYMVCVKKVDYLVNFLITKLYNLHYQPMKMKLCAYAPWVKPLLS